MQRMNQQKLTSFFQKSAKIVPQVLPSHENIERIPPEKPRTPTLVPTSGVLINPCELSSPDTSNLTYCMMFDGCSKGNPGPAGAGAVIYANTTEIWSRAIYVGNSETNNLAEYTGLLLGLNEAVRRNIRNLIVKGDSEVVIKQMLGKYKVKSENLLDIYEQAKELEKHFDKIDYIHVYRHLNTRADALSNEGLAKITGRK
jgi:ribonuclease HI